MNTKIGVMFLSTILSTALLARQNGMTSDILNQANSEKADGAAFAAPSPAQTECFDGLQQTKQLLYWILEPR
jgi:hypothetical protein